MTVAVCAEAFGFGPASKAVAIAKALQRRGIDQLTICSEGVAHDFFKINGFDAIDYHPSQDQDSTIERKLSEVEVAIVCLDAEWVHYFAQRGAKVIFVDSLGFMWDESFISNNRWLREIEVYVVQDVLGAHEELSRFKLENLHPVGAIIDVRDTSARERNKDMMVQLGGLITRHGTAGVSEYLRFVDGVISTIADDLPVRICLGGAQGFAIRRPESMSIEAATHTATMHYVMDCRRVLTSPGLTFLLECAAFQTAVCPLLPQNYSQVLIIKRIAAASMRGVWKLLADAYESIRWRMPELEGVAAVKARNLELYGSQDFLNDYCRALTGPDGFRPLGIEFCARFDGADEVSGIAAELLR